jgi:hypothetical protein
LLLAWLRAGASSPIEAAALGPLASRQWGCCGREAGQAALTPHLS